MIKKTLQKQSGKIVVILAFIALISFLLSFFYIPLVKIFTYAFHSSSKSAVQLFLSVFSQSNNIRYFSFSFIQASISTAICLIFGIPTGYFFAKYNFKGKKLILNLLTIPFVLPPIVVLLGFVITYGQGGWVNQLWREVIGTSSTLINIYGTYQGIILAHVFYNLSVIIRLTVPAWLSVDYEQVEVAKTLGVNNLKIFWKIITPQIINFIVTAALLVFIYCFNSFAIVLYLGEVRYQTLEVRIYKLMKTSLKFGEGSALAIIQLIINTIIIIIYIIFDNKTRKMALGKEKELKIAKISFSKENWKQNLILTSLIGYISVILIFSFAPLIAVIIQSLTPYNANVSPFWGYKRLFSVEYLPILGNSPLRMLGNTLLFAFCTTIITLILSTTIMIILHFRYHRIKKYRQAITEDIISYLIILPMATSTITLAVGLFLQFKDSILYLNYVWVLIISSHILISIPFATRSILSAYNRIDKELINIGSTLGASRLYIFKNIEFPLIARSLIVAGIFSFAISLGEFGATNFLVRGKWGTLSIGIFKLISTQTLQLPSSMASLLIVVTALAFMIIQQLGEIELKV